MGVFVCWLLSATIYRLILPLPSITKNFSTEIIMKVNGIVSGAARCLVLRVVGVAGLMFTLAACQTGGGSGFAEEGIGYRACSLQ